MFLFLLLLLLLLLLLFVVFRSIALQRAFFLPLSFFLSLRGNALILSRTPFVCLNNPPFFSHTPIIHSLPHLHLHRSRQFIRRWKATIWIIRMIAPPISITQIGVVSSVLSLSLSFSRDRDIKQTKKENHSTYGKSTRGILNAKAITSP